MRHAGWWISLVAAALVGALATWWFWPRPEAEIQVIWQGEPEFARQP